MKADLDHLGTSHTSIYPNRPILSLHPAQPFRHRVIKFLMQPAKKFGCNDIGVGIIPQVVGKNSGSSRGRTPARAGAKRKKQSRDFDRVVTPGPWNGPSPGDQAEMDRLLDKMNSVGLSEAERKRLSELGKRLRGS